MSQITIQQSASQLNLANSDMLWELTSVSSSAAQFQYVCALQNGCGTVLTTIKQQANPSGKGVFNLGRIVRQYLDYDNHALTIGDTGSLFNKNSQTAKFFKVAFGEEFGTSTTSSVISYSGVGNATGSAAFTGSIPYYYLINGVLDPNSGDWNWATGSYFKMEAIPFTGSFSYNVALTDAPRSQSIKAADYASISVLNGNLNQSTSSAQDIAFVEYNVYSGSISSSYLFDNLNNTNTIYSGGPRTGSISSTFPGTIQPCSSSAQPFQTSGSLLLHIGVGPQNLIDNGNVPAITGSWDYYTVKLYPRAVSSANTSASWDSFTFTRQTDYCEYDGKRFAFINNYGVWDYFNFTLATNQTTALDYGLYKQTFVPYNTTTNNVPYNRERRGTNNYYKNISENFQVYSDWLTQAEADWLGQLFYSPNVYVQEGTTWLPIIITDTQFQTKTNPRTQKNFNYVVNFTLANNKRSR
jgi:hypothetical protein